MQIGGIDGTLARHMNRFALIGLWLSLGTTHATSLNPGSTLGPIPIFSYGASQLPSGNSSNGVIAPNTSFQGGSWSAGTNLAGADINYADAVYTDPTNGDLEFFYQIQPSVVGDPIDSSSTNLSTVFDGCTITGLTGVAQITSASFNSFANFAKPTSSTDSISSVSLSSNDQDLTIDFSASVAPGEYSAILVIETSATSCDPYNASTDDGSNSDASGNNGNANNGLGGRPADSPGNQSNPSGSPGVPVLTPEPDVDVILSLACAGLLLLVHRRRRKGKTMADGRGLLRSRCSSPGVDMRVRGGRQ